MFTAGKPASLGEVAPAIVPTPACDSVSQPRSLDTEGTSAPRRKVLARGTNPALLVGRTPWSARDALVPPPAQRDQHLAKRKQADGGVGRGPGGPPHQQSRPFVAGKARATSSVRNAG
jgi:hypothetical protein